jgi:hypothetical protein
MRFLRPAYLHFSKRIGDVVQKSDFEALLENVNIDGADFVKENYLPGTTGQSKLYKQLIAETGIEN